MKRMITIILIGWCGLLLAGCSGTAYNRAYMAAGDGTREQDLTASEQFSPTDDLNMVVKLHRRSASATLLARFIDPNGDLLQEIEAEAPSSVGTVVLGIDYEGRQDRGNQWRTGRYRVELFVDAKQVETLYFRVD